MALDTALDHLLHNGHGTMDAGSKIYGVVPAIVTAVNDPQKKRESMGMVQIYFPWLQKKEGEPNLLNPWARVVMPNAGKGVGLHFIPQVGDEVVVGFEHGDPAFPYVLGGLWNGEANAPGATTPKDSSDCKGHGPGAPTHKTPDLTGDTLSGDKGKNDTYFQRSRSGNLMVLDDKEGTIRMADRSGTSVVQIEKDNIRVLQRTGDIHLSAKSLVRFDCNNFILEATNNITFTAKGGTYGTKSGGNTSHQAGNKWTAKAEKNIEKLAKGNLSWTAGSTMSGVADAAKLFIKAQGQLKAMAGMKFNTSSNGDLKLKAKGPMIINSLMDCNFNASGEQKVNAGGPIIAASMRINVN